MNKQKTNIICGFIIVLLFPLTCFAGDLEDFNAANDLHYKDGNHTAAIAAFERFLQDYPQSKYLLEVKLDLVRLYKIEKQYANALVLADEVIGDPNVEMSITAKFEKAELLKEWGKSDEAKTQYLHIISTHSDHPYRFFSEYKIADLLLDLKSYDEAIVHYDAAIACPEYQETAQWLKIRIANNRGKVYWDKAISLRDANDYNGAKAQFLNILSTFPDDQSLRIITDHELANLMLKYGDYNGAVTHYAAAMANPSYQGTQNWRQVRIKEGFIEAKVHLTGLLNKTSLSDSAISTAVAALKADIGNEDTSWGLYRAGELYLMDAMAARETDPNNAATKYQLGLVLLEKLLADNDLQVSDIPPRVHFSIGNFAYQYGDYDRAIPNYKAAVVHNVYGGFALYKLGQIYKIRGQYEDARNAFQAVIDDFPDSKHAEIAKIQLGKLAE